MVNLIRKISEKFCIQGNFICAENYGRGHINDTYLASFSDGEHRIIQKINSFVFKNPELVMENMVKVISHLIMKIFKEGGDAKRETLNLIAARDGLPYHIDGDGNYWRAFLFIEDSFSYEKIEKGNDLYDTGLIFGKFQRLLSDFKASELHHTIPDFHNTKIRYENLFKAVSADIAGRVNRALPEIKFIEERREYSALIQDQLDASLLPLRVTHNDTKLNNVLFDCNTRKPLCVVDLDTVMPGSILFDFGDAIRTGASTAEEDETDLSKVSFDLDSFKAFAEGFLEEAGSIITERERDCLPISAVVLSYEQGIRFLADYLEGDRYYKTSRDDHNLDRCRTQLKLVKEMEEILRNYKF
ncbi:MAG: aminoglycoside phosphotransferase family protein [Treponema sp.]|nr:aminoglycoside phosphotransferase family protein [Treponema sp.]